MARDLRNLKGLEPGTYVHWDLAGQHLGEKKRVCGPVESIRIDVSDVHATLKQGAGSEFEIVIWEAPDLAEQWSDVDDQPGLMCATGKIIKRYGTVQIQTRRVQDVWGF